MAGGAGGVMSGGVTALVADYVALRGWTTKIHPVTNTREPSELTPTALS